VEASKRYLHRDPVMVGPGVKTSVRVARENPKEVGADRIANALAAYTKYGGPVIVIGLWHRGHVRRDQAPRRLPGGAIAPGVEISLDALSRRRHAAPVEPVAPDSGHRAKTQ